MGSRDNRDLTLRMRERGFDVTTARVRKLRKEIRDTSGDSRKAHGSLRLFSSGLRPMVSLATSAGAALGALGLAGGARIAIGAASDLSEEINKTNVVFRGSQREVLSWSKTSAEGFGQSRQQALAAANVFGNMLVPLDFGRKRAAGMSKQMVQLAGDMASFNNADPSEVLEAMRSGLAGEAEPLRKYGVFINDARLRQEAMAKGLYDGTGVLSNHARAVATYALILRDTKDAQGDFARTSGGLANQQRILRAELTDLAAEIGTSLLPFVNKGTHALVGFIRGFRKGTGAGGKFRDVLGDVADDAKALWGWIKRNQTGVLALTAAVLAGVGAWKAYMIVKRVLVLGKTAVFLYKAWRAGTLGLATAQLGLNAAMVANPIGLIVVGIAALVAALTVAYFKVGWFRDGVNAAFGAVKTAVGGAVSFIKTIWPTIWKYLKWTPMVVGLRIAWAAIKTLFTRGFKGLLNLIIENLNKVIGIFNQGIHAYNKIPLAPDLPDIPTIGTLDEGGSTGGQRVKPVRGRRNRQFLGDLLAPPALAGASSGGDVVIHSTTLLDGRVVARNTERQSVKKKSTR
jgi:hypothetical protein